MKNIVRVCLAASAIAAAACSNDTSAPASQLAVSMASAFNATPAGYSNLNSSFVGDAGGPFMPEFGRMGRDGRVGPALGGPGFGLGFMGGGLFGGFHGDDFGRGFAPVDTSCHFDSGTGLITCGPRTRNGLTITRVLQFQTATNQSQPAFDPGTTNSVTAKITVTGTVTRRDGDQSTISSSSNQTVTGLATGSTARTVNSASAGSENTTGTSVQGAFTAKRATGDTVTGVVIPVATSAKRWPYPTAGTVIRAMSATVQVSGQAATTASRREVITYDGSATAKVVITFNGATQNCTLPLPFGRLTCS